MPPPTLNSEEPQNDYTTPQDLTRQLESLRMHRDTISPSFDPSSRQSHSTFLDNARMRTHGRAKVIKPQPYALPRPIPLTRA